MGKSSIDSTRVKVEAGLGRRYRKEQAFRVLGLLATAVGVVFLAVFFASLIGQGKSAFVQTWIELEVEFSEEILAPAGELDLVYADFDGIVRAALRKEFPDVTNRRERRDLYKLVSVGAAYELRDMIEVDPDLLGETVRILVPASANVDMVINEIRLTARFKLVRLNWSLDVSAK